MAIRTTWPLAAVGLAIALSAQPAGANGRFPATVSVQHVPGDDNSIFLPSTFGLLYSTDDGASFRWVCEQAIGYTGVYDPDYALQSDGTIWATTFDGLRVTRDGGCNWTTIGGPLDGKFIGEVEVGPDGTIWATTSTGGEQNDVYKSTNGADFTATGLVDGAAWWRTLRVAPTDANRIYVTGFRPSDPTGDAMTEPEALAYRSDNGGTSWTPLDLSQITFGTVPQLDLVAVAPDDPDTVWAVAVTANEPIGDSLYVSTDAGANWTKILDVNDIILAFLVVDNAGEYEIHVGTINDGNRTSLDSGDSWTRTETPRQACISRRSDGTYFSCGANWDPDFFALGRSTDAQSWEKVVRFSEIAGPVSCDPGTVQFDVCESQVWPDLVEMFGIGQPDAGPGGNNDGGDSDAGMDKPPKDGCFDCSGGGSAGGLLIGLAALLAIRRRRLA